MKTLKDFLEQKYETKARAGVIPYCIEKNKYYVALMKPSDPRYGGSSFQMVKGLTEEGDTPQITAVKECQQEIGLTIEEASLKLLWNNKTQNIHWFFTRRLTKDPLNPMANEDGIVEASDAEWFEFNEALEIIRDWQKPILLMLKRKLGIK